MIRETPLAAASGVNAQVICNCRCTTFEIGLAFDPETKNNFIRVIQCAGCGKQLPATHKSEDGSLPALMAG